MTTLYSIPLYKSSYLHQLSRINNSIYGVDSQSLSFFQIDLKHSIVWEHNILQTSISPLLQCKFIDNLYFGNKLTESSTKQGYLCIFPKTIQKISFFNQQNQSFVTNSAPFNKKPSQTLLTSNSMASFTGVFDAYHNSLVFSKLHENHLKYSINWLEQDRQGNSEKKIIKLLDHNPKSITINRHLSQQVIYTDEQNHAKYFDINKPQIQTSLAKKSILLFDSNHLYCTSANLVSKFNDTYQVQTIDLNTGKYTFTFKGNGMPKKVQSYGNFIFYMTARTLQIYDKRKGEVLWKVGVVQQEKIKNINEGLESLKEFGKYAQRRVSDFLIEPNLGKIYVSLSNQLRVLDFSFF